MTVRVIWKGYDREWCVVNNGGQVIRDGFSRQWKAEEWAEKEGYEVQD